MKNVILNSAAWSGDKEITLNFPDSWNLEIIGDEIHPQLNNQELKEAFDKPIGSSLLSNVASGKTKAAIIVDDINHPTPASLIIHFILEDLKEAGILNKNIIIVFGVGTHKPAAEDEIKKKLGKISPEIKVVSHNCKQNLKFVGKSSKGKPIYVNKTVMNCDLKIGVGCIYPHISAGFSGGSKIIVPGICGLETISHIHSSFKTAKRRGDITNTEFKREIEELAEKVGLDFIVNVVLNQKRQITALFSGDRKEAYAAGVEHALKIYSIGESKNADIIISDCYPFDSNLMFAHSRGFWPLFNSKSNTTFAAIADCSAGIGYHELHKLKRSVFNRVIQRLKKVKSHQIMSPLVELQKLARFYKNTNRQILLLSEGISQDEITSVIPNAKVFTDWNILLNELESRHNQLPVKVAIYRCAPFLIPRQ